MKKIRFIADYKVNAVGGESYKEGQEVVMSNASCLHFLNRNVAVFVAEVSEGKEKAK